MERINRILNHEKYRAYLQQNRSAEEGRVFCKHDMDHFLDVARIGWIFILEKGLPIERDVMYAAALLHDIGRHLEYSAGIPHEKASAELAPGILRDCGFDGEETKTIRRAIEKHRDKDAAKEENLNGILYLADKASRACFACGAETLCDWNHKKKNLEIRC